MIPKARLFFAFLLLGAFPARAGAAPLAQGDRVLVTGSAHRKCSARIASVPSPGFARVEFDRAGCGDASAVYDLRRLQRISFVPGFKGFAAGDSVVIKGHFANDCSGKIHEVSRSGYVTLDLDSFLCADGESLHKTEELRKVEFVSMASLGDRRFAVGQRVSAKGIHAGDVCRGEIRKLTDGGLALVSFDEQTCAYGGKLYSLEDLESVRAKPAHHANGELIFQRVMREIASQKKAKKDARL